MSTTVKVQIQQRIDTASNWASANPTPLSGEICWNSDDKKYKIGDGSTAWASLTYAPGSGGYTAGTGVSISASNVITASAVALTTVQTAANQTAHLALTTQEGDIVVRSDENKSYVRNSGSAGSMADYTLLATPTDAVLSVNGNTGAITADQLAAAIESATDSNTFTDADHTKLNGIDASANNYSISTDLLDEDNFSTNSATKVASQQSIKAYVDTADALKANLSGANFTGDVVFTGDAANVTWDKSTDDLIFNDNAKAIFGTSSDGVAIYHDGTHSYIKDSGTGNLVIQTNVLGIQAANGLEDLAKFSQDGSVDLFFDGTKKFESTSAGATLSGHLQLDGHLDMNDSHYIKLGTGDDLSIYHSGSLSMIDNTEGNLHIRNQATSGQIKIQPKSGEDGINVIQDGAVEAFFDNSKKFETVSWGARVTGTFEASTDIQVTDAGKFNAGSSNDLQIYNNGLNSYVANTTGYLFIQSDDFSVGAKSVGENMIVANVNDGVDLYFDGSKKAETVTGGFTVTGVCTATSFSGDGSNLTNLPAAGGSVTLTANGAIAANKPTIVNSSGQAEEVAIQAASVGSETEFSTDGSDVVKMAGNGSGQFVVVSVVSNNLKLRVASVSGTTVSFGAEASINTSSQSSYTQFDICYASTVDRYMIVYRGSSNKGYCRALQVSGTTITIGTESSAMEANYANRDFSIAFADFATNTSGMCAIHCVRDVSSPKWLIRSVGFNGTNYLGAPSFHDLSYIAGYSSMDSFTCAWNPNQSRFYGVFNTNDGLKAESWTMNANGGMGRVGVMDNVVGTFTAGYNGGVSLAYDANAEKMILGYRSGTSLKLTVVNYDGSSWDSTSTEHTAGSSPSSIKLNYFPATKQMLVSYVYNNDGRIRPVTINSTTSYTNGTSTTYESDAANQQWSAIDGTGALVGFTNSSNSNRAEGRYYRASLTNLTTGNFVGFANAAINSGSSGAINVVGNTTTQSSLTAGEKYYVQGDGTLATTADAYVSVEAGNALSSTSLLIK
jgi:hypothetical protein